MDFPRPREIHYSPLPDAKGKVRHQVTPPLNLGLLHRWLANRKNDTASATYHYRVDWARLLAWWGEQSEQYGQLPLALDCRSAVLPLATGRQLVPFGLTGLPKLAQLVKPSSLNWFDLQAHTSVDVTAGEGPHQSHPESVSASERAPVADISTGSFGAWLAGDTAKAIRRLFVSEGWHETTIDDALYKAFERGHRYVDVVDCRERLRRQYDANPKLTQWPGFFASEYLRGYSCP